VVVDTGPLTAFLDAGDAWHRWAVARFQEMEGPLVTVEPVLTEAGFLLQRNPGAQDDLLRMVAQGALKISFRLEDEAEAVRLLRSKYGDLPMSLADACLVRQAEMLGECRICTLDSDFRIYRKHGRTPLSLITPE
jgi:predicted nucleic acid-binding protein